MTHNLKSRDASASKNHPVQDSDPKRDEHALWIAAEKEEGVPDIILTQSDGEEVAAPAG